MKTLSIEKMENLSGGCGIVEMAFYAERVTYYASQGNYVASFYYSMQLQSCF